MARKEVPTIKRLLSKLVKDPITQCWNFTGATIISRGGYHYGVISYHYKHVLVHRYMYWYHFLRPQELELSKNICVCHHCDNPLCCNPDHLFLGTHKDNSQDASRKGRLQRGEKHTGNKLTEKQILEIYRASGTLKEIGQRYSIDTRYVLAIKNREVWKWLTKNENPIKENHSIKLSEAQVTKIYFMRGTCESIGKKYGIGRTSVSNIKTGKTWKHITGALNGHRNIK